MPLSAHIVAIRPLDGNFGAEGPRRNIASGWWAVVDGTLIALHFGFSVIETDLARRSYLFAAGVA